LRAFEFLTEQRLPRRSSARIVPTMTRFTEDGFLRYRYRGSDPHHHDNVGLRTAMQRQTPLIYLPARHRPGPLRSGVADLHRRGPSRIPELRRGDR
jgi:hypothetical protein